MLQFVNAFQETWHPDSLVFAYDMSHDSFFVHLEYFLQCKFKLFLGTVSVI